MADSVIQVLLVDDSSMVREMLREILEQEPDMLVVGEATNGQEALEKARLLKPSLITMDLEMPVMNGMEAITVIMGAKAVPILVVSSVADAQQAYEAVRRGALDVVAKPNISDASVREFVTKVRMLAKVPVITHIRPIYVDEPQGAPPRRPLPALQTTTGNRGAACPVFAIAASTGGPQALARILPQLPADFPCPVLIAQHISEGFAAGMAEWLSGLCKLPVRLALHGEPVCPGSIFLAQPEYHCTINSARQIVLVERSLQDIYRPSCDHLLESVASIYRTDAIGIILTGMGKDGAQGIAGIRRNGGITIGQDQASSLIYGMNRCAIEAGNVQKVLPESAIADEMIRLARGQR
jgi:two-component system chemotaxis response regulator CheB